MPPPRPLSMKMIEIERKFRVSQTTKSLLESLSSSKSFVEFEDCYLCEELALEDIWLRKRNETWELKMPLASNPRKRPGVTIYRELVGQELWDELSWRKEIKIVLDVCTSKDGFQYSVGELEILVNHDSEVVGATTVLDKFAASLNLEAESDEHGKLITYLKEKNESLYHALVLRGLT